MSLLVYYINRIRTEKEINGVTTKYHLENSSIIYEQQGNNTIYYLYDLTGLVGLKYNNNTYYYIKNIQGDIIGILDQDYNEIVTYEYDSWGKLLNIKVNQGDEITDETNIGIINPFRYREYYYDTETGLYYLNNRYYNPTWGRFLNADRILGSNGDILSYNLYLYTSNNSINNLDPNGQSIWDCIKNRIRDAVYQIPFVKDIKYSTDAERKNLIQHPIKSIKGIVSKIKAVNIGREKYGAAINVDNSEANAYKHAMWSAIMTYDMNKKDSDMIGTAHEDGETNLALTNMDLHNNAIGREIGEIYKQNERIIRPVPSRVHTSPEVSFTYLGKAFKTRTSRQGAYEVMSDMIQHAINQGILIVSTS